MTEPTAQQENNNQMEELYNKITQKTSALSADMDMNVHNGNKAAGTRARKATTELEKLFKRYRKLSIESAK